MKNLIKIIKNPKLKIILTIFILFFIYTSICAISYSQNISNNISDSVFRLHVIANSNTIKDQNLKYLVRDNLIEYMDTISQNAKNKNEAIKIAEKNIETFNKIANQTIQDNNYTYPVKVNIGTFDFPTKNYGDISLPAGIYDALRIEIGEAKGENWWCVMFPPLCFIDATTGVVPEDSKQIMEKSLTDEEYLLISKDSNTQTKFKFKLIEFFNRTGLITAKK